MTFWTALNISSIWQSFLDSNFFVGLSTIFTVAGAIILYKRQKDAEKRQIAALLVNEIRNAETAIQALKTRNKANEIPELIILPQNNWNKYSHLFIKDLDSDQINGINRFYFDIERANYIVNYGNTVELFLLNIRSRLMTAHETVSGIIDKSSKVNLKKNMANFNEKFQNVNSYFHYSPIGFTTILDSHLEIIIPILDSPAGLKLKQMADL
ncbi:MAG: hypothetical protein PHE48_00930 [Candidatus Daviesbacteria bacterium]|nr:hypothetical protein [Candidatus Daviesbacteria bacterium]